MTTTRSRTRYPRSALLVAVIGFFVVTLDATIVNVVLPSLRDDLGGGVAGMQWVVDGYTLPFAALLLTAGSVTDRLGARAALMVGLATFALASAACGLAPSLSLLIAARVVQGAAAAIVMPASMALIRHSFPDSAVRNRALAIWATGGAVAATSGPLLGGALTAVSWRWVFLVNLPVSVVALLLLTRVGATPGRDVPFDIPGQLVGLLAIGGLAFGAIEAGPRGFTAPIVVVAFAVALLAGVVFVRIEGRARHPMLPPALVRTRAVPETLAIGFAFMVGYFGVPFIVSLYLQQVRGLSPLATGATFLPMMATGLILTPFSTAATMRFGRRAAIVAGLVTMTLGLVIMAITATSAPIWLLMVTMMLVGVEDAESHGNTARFVFLSPAARNFFPDWERNADDIVATMRTYAGQHPRDKPLTDLIGELVTRSDAFRLRWAAHNVRHHRAGIKRICHPDVGDLELTYEAMDLPANPEWFLFGYTAEPGSPTEERLKILGSLAASSAHNSAPLN